MTQDDGLSLPTGRLKRDVREATSSLDELMQAFVKLESGLKTLRRSEATELEGVLKQIKKFELGAFASIQKDALTKIQAGNIKLLDVEREMSRALQQLYEARYSMRGKFSDQELAQLKESKVKLVEEHRAQLKDYEAVLKQEAALAKQQVDARNATAKSLVASLQPAGQTSKLSDRTLQQPNGKGGSESVALAGLKADEAIAKQREKIDIDAELAAQKIREDNFKDYEARQQSLKKTADAVMLQQQQETHQQVEAMWREHENTLRAIKAADKKQLGAAVANEIAQYNEQLDQRLAAAKQNRANLTAEAKQQVADDLKVAGQREDTLQRLEKQSAAARLSNHKAYEDRKNEISKTAAAVYKQIESDKASQLEAMWKSHESQLKQIKKDENAALGRAVASELAQFNEQLDQRLAAVKRYKANEMAVLQQSVAVATNQTAAAYSKFGGGSTGKLVETKSFYRPEVGGDTIGGEYAKYDAVAVKAAKDKADATAVATNAARQLKIAEMELRLESKNLAPELDKGSKALRNLAFSGNDAHSAARGLASGFGLLWLTWGNMLPLLATAALSNSFREVVQTGRVVEQQLAIIGALGGATGEQVDGLRNRITELARSGPVGVTEIAEAMKVLSLAGMQANEILGATQVVLDFSVAGTTDLKTAAETLMSVSTAFNMGSGGFREVSDVISKAAAESMTSVENFSSAMKTASVINAQYGVSLKDTAVNIAALSQLGIQASAAGTAVRNMYADLSGRSTQVAKVLKQQGIELRDNNGKFRDLVTIVGELDDKFSKLTGKGKANLMQALLSERGAKPIVELLRMVQTEATVTGKSFSNALEEMRGKLDNIGGFSAEAAARLNQTADNQLKSVTSSFSATMLDAYKSIEPSLIVIATNLKALFADDTFKAFLSGMANFMATLGRVVSENIGAFTLLAGVYAASKVAGWALAFVTDKLSVEKKKLLTLTLENGAAMTIEATAENRSLASKYALIRAEQALNKEKQAGTLITQGNAAKTTATGLAGAAVGVAGVAGAAVAGAGIVDAAGNVIRSQKGIADATDAATRATVDNGKETAKDMSTKMKWIGWLGRAAGALNYVGMAITLGTVGYSLYEMWQNKSADAASRAASITENNVATAMNKEADMLERINSLMATGLSLRDATARASVMGTAPSELDAAKTKLESLKEQKKLYDKTYGSQISAASSGTEVSRVASNGAALDREITATTAQVAKLERPVTEATNRLKLANAEREKLIKAEEDRRKKAITGTGMFELGQGANGGGLRQQGANAFDSLIKGFNEASRSAIAAAKDQQALMDGFPATLPYLKAFENDLEKIDEQFEMAKKNMKPDAEGYAQAVKQLELGRLMARAAAEQKKNDAEYAYGVAETKKALEEYAVAVAKVVELKRADARAAWEATRAYEAERAEKERSFKVMEDDAKAKDAQRGMTPADAAAYAAQYEIQKKYAGERFKIEQELQKDLEGLVDQDGIEDYQAANRKILQANKKLADLEKDRAKETSIATAQVYKEEWQKTTDSIASDLTNRLMEGTLDAGDFLKDTFKNLVLRPQMELAMKGLMDGVFGGMGGGSSGGGGIFGFLGSLFSFDGGGYTGDGSRSGGLDGKGGFLAMLHPQETVTDHTKGQAVESSSAPVTVIINNTVGDVATKSMLDQYQQSTVKQVQAGLMRSSRYGGAASA